ncbi:hypothetical protein K445DRAFT_121551 [Daldinia sp. EC12]|nr:hypothetical protein K445DRAFT_121551 [Daldinia sp. EC12]
MRSRKGVSSAFEFRKLLSQGIFQCCLDKNAGIVCSSGLVPRMMTKWKRKNLPETMHICVSCSAQHWYRRAKHGVALDLYVTQNAVARCKTAKNNYPLHICHIKHPMQIM